MSDYKVKDIIKDYNVFEGKSRLNNIEAVKKEIDLASLKVQITSKEEIENPNIVKVIN